MRLFVSTQASYAAGDATCVQAGGTTYQPEKVTDDALPCAGVYKQNSASELSAQQLGTCIENTAKRRASLLQLLQQTLSGE